MNPGGGLVETMAATPPNPGGGGGGVGPADCALFKGNELLNPEKGMRAPLLSDYLAAYLAVVLCHCSNCGIPVHHSKSFHYIYI